MANVLLASAKPETIYHRDRKRGMIHHLTEHVSAVSSRPVAKLSCFTGGTELQHYADIHLYITGVCLSTQVPGLSRKEKQTFVKSCSNKTKFHLQID